MRVGIFISAESSWGGVYQYAHSLVSALKKYDKINEYVIFVAGADSSFDHYAGNLWQVARASGVSSEGATRETSSVRLRLLKKMKATFSGTPLEVLKRTRIYRNVRAKAYGGALGRQLAEYSIDLVIYATHNVEAASTGVPFIIAVHDIQHRFQPEFPEVSADGEASEREWFFRNVPRQAVAVLVDSETGKEDLIEVCGIEPARVKVFPFLPPPHLFEQIPAEKLAAVRAGYYLPSEFFFYPAQFWPHKNHELIIRGLARIREEHGLRPTVVFSGNKDVKYSTFEKVSALARELGVSEQMLYLGYVPSDDIAALYRLALALVMPTFFGPTNIPVLEAFAQGCPVITSDIRGIREQVGGAGLLIDPRDPAAMAGAMLKILSDTGLRRTLAQEGRRKVTAWTEADFAAKLMSVIAEQARSMKSVGDGR